MTGGQLRRSARRMGPVGSPRVTGGGERCSLLLRPNGAFWQVAGGLVMVRGGLNWAVECCGEGCGLDWFSDRNWGKCLWWFVWSVVRFVGEALGG